MERDTELPRRAVVRAAAAFAGGASLAGCTSSQLDPRDTETPEVKDENRDPGSGEQPEHEESEEAVIGATEIRLEAYQEGWEGVEPEEIAGEVNPRLDLEVGAEYELSFENADGREHELELRDENEEPLESSDHVEEEGDVGRVAFEATEEVEWYVCEYHEQRMHGAVEFPEDPADGN